MQAVSETLRIPIPLLPLVSTGLIRRVLRPLRRSLSRLELSADKPPANNLTHAVFVTGLCSALRKAAGKHLYFALRWENTRGEKGPWSRAVKGSLPFTPAVLQRLNPAALPARLSKAGSAFVFHRKEVS
jgi:hypothetical protein